MDAKTKAAAEKAVASLAASGFKPLPGYALGFMDAAILDDQVVLILLDGRKKFVDLENVNMRAKAPAPKMKPEPAARTTKSRASVAGKSRASVAGKSRASVAGRKGDASGKPKKGK